MKGMSQDRNALHGGKQVHGKTVGVFPFRVPKLALDPGQVLSEDLGRSGGDRAARLVELGAKTSRPRNRAAPSNPCSEDALDAGAKPILGRSSFVPSLPLRGQLRQPQFDDRLANLVLGLEVIIDVAERNLASRAMSASEVASNPFWYAKPTAALTSRDRLSICVLAMCISPSTNLDMTGSVNRQALRSLILTYPTGRSPLYEAHFDRNASN